MIGRILAVALFIIALLSIPVISEDTTAQSVKYAEVTSPRVIIRREVEPKSELVLTAKAGQVFEITGEGKLWVQVKTENGEGWIPVSDCRVVDRKKTSLLSSPGSTLAFVGVIALGLAVSVYFIIRRKEDEDSF